MFINTSVLMGGMCEGREGCVKGREGCVKGGGERDPGRQLKTESKSIARARSVRLKRNTLRADLLRSSGPRVLHNPSCGCLQTLCHQPRVMPY